MACLAKPQNVNKVRKFYCSRLHVDKLKLGEQEILMSVIAYSRGCSSFLATSHILGMSCRECAQACGITKRKTAQHTIILNYSN